MTTLVLMVLVLVVLVVVVLLIPRAAVGKGFASFTRFDPFPHQYPSILCRALSTRRDRCRSRSPTNASHVAAHYPR